MVTALQIKPLLVGWQKRAAEDLGIKPSQVSGIKSGQRKCPHHFSLYMEEKYGIDRRSWYWTDFPSIFLSEEQKEKLYGPRNQKGNRG